MIPNLLHVIHLDSRPFTYLHFLAVKRAIQVNHPDKVFLWNDQEPVSNVWWQAVKFFTKVERRQVEAHREWRGLTLTAPQHQADVIRLEALRDFGGYYIDLDILCLRSFDDLRMNYTCVMGSEHDDEQGRPRSLSNAVILAEANHPFVCAWLDALPNKWRKDDWAYHSVCLPLEMAKDFMDVTLLPHTAFIPFTFRQREILGPCSASSLSVFQTYPQSYTFHLWETIWKKECAEISPTVLFAPKTLLHLFLSQLHRNKE